MENILVTNLGFGTSAGELEMTTEGGKVVTSVGDSNYVDIKLRTTQGILRTPLMHRDYLRIEKVVKVDGVVNVVTFTPTGSFVDGGSAGVIITAGEGGIPMFKAYYDNYDVAVNAGGSVGNALSAIAAQINKSSKVATATATATTLVVTAKSDEYPLFVNGTGGFSVYVVAQTTPYVAPLNSGKQILKVEDVESAHKGNMHSLTYGNKLYSQKFQTDVTKDYTTYLLTFKNPKQDILQGQGEPYLQTVTIACETSKATAAFEDVLKLINANTGL